MVKISVDVKHLIYKILKTLKSGINYLMSFDATLIEMYSSAVIEFTHLYTYDLDL